MSEIGKREEISDVISEGGLKRLRKDDVLHFGNDEVGHTYLKITKIDRKNKRVWAEHVLPMVDFNTGMSHYGHDIDTEAEGQPFCRDCNVDITEPSTEDGDVKARNRADAKEQLQRMEDDPNKIWQYILLKQDGTREDLGQRTKMTFGDMYKILNCTTIELVPMAYWTEEFNVWGASIYADENARADNTNVRNPHFHVLEGDPSIGEPEEWDVVGNAIVELEV